MSNYIINFIRTTVAGIVGALGAWLAIKGVQVPSEVLLALTTALTGLFAAFYTYVVNLLTEKYPQLGWLLGYPKTPTY